MNDKRELFPIELRIINNINFTRREIDVMACLVSARIAGKSIASVLLITLSTVANHISNMTSKIGCNSREGIIDFIEKFNRQFFLRAHYSYLLSLKKIVKEVHKPLVCSLIYWKDQENDHFLLKNLEADLKLVGLNVLLGPREKENLITSLSESSPTEHYSIYLMPKKLEDIEAMEHSKGLSITKQVPDNSLFLFIEKEGFKKIPQNFSGARCIDCTESENYYFIVFNILKSILHDVNIDQIIEDFKQQYEVKNEVSEDKNHPEEVKAQKDIASYPFSTKLFKEKKRFFLIGLVAALSIVGVVLLNHKEVEKGFLIPPNFVVPTTLLTRSGFIDQIDKKFKGQNDIQNLALVGLGGSGKTTLAHQYAYKQKANTVWEINAETIENIDTSFENLAYKLAKTEEEKKLLKELLETKNSSEKQEQLISFVKDHLKLDGPWFLIFDNVENFSDIQKYFPQDVNTWGKGKIILTTRSEHIQNSPLVNHVILIGEFTSEQKQELFIKIMNSEKARIKVDKEMSAFLEYIPPFPLDVSAAASYLKTTNISYAQYLDYLNNMDKKFTDLQERIPRDVGEYTKTRYSIITQSLDHLIKNDKDFVDILLLISLLDSQNIPKSLLDQYKSSSIVDNFIYQLKKYSLISAQTSPASSEAMYTIHRSTQEISLHYLIELLKLNKEGHQLKEIAHLLDDYADQAIEQEDFARIRLLAPHLEKALKHRTLLTDFSQGLLESKLGSIYYFINNDKAKDMLDSSLKTLVSEPSKSNARLARALLPIGAVYTELRFDKEAKEVLEKAIHIYGKEGTKNYYDLARTLSHLGDLQKRLGNFEEARDFLEESIRIQKQYETDNKHIPRTLAYLGSVYRGLGFYQKAIDTLKESLAIYKEHYPNDHIRIGWTLIHLGNVHRRLANFNQAKDVLEEGLTIFQKHLPDDHVSMGLALAYLGGCYRGLGDYEKSRGYLEDSLRIHQKHFDENHVKMGWILFHLARTYKAMGNNKAQKLFDKVLEIYASHCDEGNIEAAHMLRNMAKICIDKNRLEDADNYIQRSLKILQSRHHVEAYKALKTLGEILLKKSTQSTYAKNNLEAQDLRNQAIDKFNEALKITEQHFPKDSVHIQEIHTIVKRIQK